LLILILKEATNKDKSATHHDIRWKLFFSLPYLLFQYPATKNEPFSKVIAQRVKMLLLAEINRLKKVAQELYSKKQSQAKPKNTGARKGAGVLALAKNGELGQAHALLESDDKNLNVESNTMLAQAVQEQFPE
jgi:hypothetical protein